VAHDYLVTEAEDYLMTEKDDYIVLEYSAVPGGEGTAEKEEIPTYYSG
jgi:hypothetical protein